MRARCLDPHRLTSVCGWGTITDLYYSFQVQNNSLFPFVHTSDCKILSSFLVGSLDLRLDLTDPPHPIFTETSEISVSCGITFDNNSPFFRLLSPLSVTTFLYSNLIPQHPVPLASVSPNRQRQSPHHPRANRP